MEARKLELALKLNFTCFRLHSGAGGLVWVETGSSAIVLTGYQEDKIKKTPEKCECFCYILSVSEI